MIGIISYLPDDEIVRNVRYWRFRGLLRKLKATFPDEKIVVVGQNYTDAEVEQIDLSIDVRRYAKLGVIGARNTLRQIFLDSNEEYIILYDDDSEICCNVEDGGKKFIECLKTNKYGWVSDKTHNLKNVGLRRSIVEKVVHRTVNNQPDDYFFFCDLVEALGMTENYQPLIDDGLRPFIVDTSLYTGDEYSIAYKDDV